MRKNDNSKHCKILARTGLGEGIETKLNKFE